MERKRTLKIQQKLTTFESWKRQNRDWICFMICGTKTGRVTPRFQIRDYQNEKNHESSDCDTAYSPNNSWFAVQHIRSFPGKIC